MGGKKITSTEIKIALAKMHNGRNTYFLTECKTCSTYFPDPQGLLIFDGLAITKSYTKPCITGYEIKVSRGDFSQDAKWHLYLQYCNEFFFVVPKGLIRKDELPVDVGLIYYDPEAKTVLHTLKKALYREIEKPVGIYEYILYSRYQEDRIPFYESRAEYVKDYLEDKAYKRCIGSKLGSKMAIEYQSALEKLERLSGREFDLECWAKVRRVLEKYNLIPYWLRDNKDFGWVDELDKTLSSQVRSKDIDILNRQLRLALETVQRIKEANAEDDKS